MYLKQQSSLLKLGGLFLALQGIILTLAPAVRLKSWFVNYQWSQWVLICIWVALIHYCHLEFKKHIPDADPIILPIAVTLSGWGLLTIWRIEPEFGIRQAVWFTISLLVFIAGIRIPSIRFLRNYKYTLLIGGVGLTALTLLFGTNPSGYGPKLWLGCCNIYFQPSEPLKLLLIIFLAAYFSERIPYRLTTLYTLYPTFILGSIVILLLLVQRDLGTACIFIALYTIVAYLATNKKTIIIINLLAIIVTGFAGYFLVNIIQYRIESWIYPWNDPQGGSYQIIQSLMAFANGGIEGRGPGLGSPGLVPVAISDFIYSSIAEETGLFGSLGLLALFGILVTRGMRIALRAPDMFRRLLAGGLSAYFGTQAILIIAGNIRLLPLTGVTLPFVSYGGSSLLTSFIATLILLIISNNSFEVEPAPLENPTPYLAINLAILMGLFASALATGWWAVIRGPDLMTRRDNLRLVIEEKYVHRGSILDRNNSPITITSGEIGNFSRLYQYTDLAPITGYNHPIYGRVGLESTLDEYLRGLRGNPNTTIWSHHLLYGMSPPGLDVRLSIDLELQKYADELMYGNRGALVLMNAESGEILAISSHPAFDPNQLNTNASDLLADPNKPLINRAALGFYPTGTILEPFAKVIAGTIHPTPEQWKDMYHSFSFDRAPTIRMDVLQPEENIESNNLHTSPLQMALAASALSKSGTIPAPRIVMAVNTPKEGWVTMPAEGKPVEAYQASVKDEAVITSYIQQGKNYWSHTAYARDDENFVVWVIGGTPPNWPSAPLSVVVLLENGNAVTAQQIVDKLITKAINP